MHNENTLKLLRKRFIALLLIGLLLVTAFPCSAFAGTVNPDPIEGYVEEWDLYWYYDESSHTLHISGNASAIDDLLAHPSLSGCAAPNIPWSSYSNEIEKVVVEKGTTTIPEEAFHSCTSLSSITIPASFGFVYKNAFTNCSSLMQINYGGTKESFAEVSDIKDDLEYGTSWGNDDFWGKAIESSTEGGLHFVDQSKIRFINSNALDSFYMMHNASLYHPYGFDGNLLDTLRVYYGTDKTGKSAMWYIQSGLDSNDFSTYITLISSAENQYGETSYDDDSRIFMGSTLQTSLDAILANNFTNEERAMLLSSEYGAQGHNIHKTTTSYAISMPMHLLGEIRSLSNSYNMLTVDIAKFGEKYTSNNYWVVNSSELQSGIPGENVKILSNGVLVDADITSQAAILPILNLSGAAISFISSATPTTASNTGAYDANNIMSIRFKNNGQISSTVSYNSNVLKVNYNSNDDSNDVYLYVLNSDDTLYSVKVDKNLEISTSSSTIAALKNLKATSKVWLETEDDSVIYAQMATFNGTLTPSGPSTYSVTYTSNGAISGTAPVDTTQYLENGIATVLGNTGSLSRDNSTFDGWQINGQGKTYKPGDTVTITGDMSFVAKWALNETDTNETVISTDPGNSTTTKIKVTGDDNIQASGLENIATSVKASNTDLDVKIVLTSESKTETEINDSVQTDAIKSQAGNNQVEFYSIKLEKYIGSASGAAIDDTGSNIVEVIVPIDSGKTITGVYRYHGTVESFTEDNNKTGADKTYYFENGKLHIFTTKFSTYAISYTEGSTSNPIYYYVPEIYTVTVPESKNGSVALASKSVYAGSTVTLSVTPDKGWTLETITVTTTTGKEVALTAVKYGEKYTFVMPSGGVTVTATFMEDNTMLNYFVDVTAVDYYYDAVLWAAENGITNGVDAMHFAPGQITTRAQMVTFLWNLSGKPEPTIDHCEFNDIDSSAYYYKAVLWAAENKVTAGTSTTTFSPNEKLTRAETVTFLYQYAGTPSASAINPFNDVANSAWYYNAVLWAKANNITVGTTDTTFSPKDYCTRGQVATFIYNYAK